MKKAFTLILLCLTPFAKADYWTQKANFGGGLRWGAVSFSIGSKGYIGTGSDSFPPTYKNDLWEYNTTNNNWTQKANFLGLPRWGAIGFNIGNKGYISTGYGGSIYLNDLWEYDQSGNSWTQKANIPVGRYDAGVFVIGLKVFVFCGSNTSGHLQDVWEWNQLTNIWTQKSNFGGGTRFEPTGFSVNNHGYAGLGLALGVWKNDIWEYDILLNSWTQKNIFGGAARAEAVGFNINSKGYIGTGETGTIPSQDFWEYDPSADLWTQKQNVGGFPRKEARGFSIGNKGFIGTGFGNSFVIQNDFWEYTPDSTTSIEEIPNTNLQFTISPNPAMEFLVCRFAFLVKTKIEITIMDVNCKKVYSQKPETTNQKPVRMDSFEESKIDVSTFSKGIYFVEVSDGKKKAVKKFVKE